MIFPRARFSANLGLWPLLIIAPLSAHPPRQNVSALLEGRIHDMEKARRSVVAGEALEYRPDLVAFYSRRGYQPAWIAFGRPGPAAWQLMDAFAKSYLEGLEPAEYHHSAADSLVRRFTTRTFWRVRMDARAAAELDILLTDGYLKLAFDLLSGRIRPKTLSDKWHISFEEADLPAYLEKALGEGDVRESLHRLAPPQEEYGIMKYWLAEYRALQAAGGWSRMPEGPDLGPHSRGPRVAALCRRMREGGEGVPGGCGESFTPELGEAVRRFQASHGLDPDGKVNRATLAQLNVPVSQRIRQIKLNLECWRWLPQDLGSRHVRVNIADFSLRAMDGKEEALTMRVVVGRLQDSTPVFSDSIVGIALNPTWNVPGDIAREEMLPELKQDPQYLEKHGMELLENWSRNARVLRADSIDWSAMDSAHFGFRVRQKSGENDALGRIKFILTNPFNIYLHDTPAKSYFARNRRAFSHGCVRVEKPADLALWILKPDSGWTRARLEAAIDGGDTSLIPLRGMGVPVHILYWTAFIDKEGGLQFRPDVYGWDRRLEEALKEGARTF